MLIIRGEQMATFSRYMSGQFESRMVLHLRKAFPEQFRDDSEQELRTVIRAGVDRARLYEVTDSTDVERFLECMVRHALDFDTAPDTAWAGDILRRDELSGTEKMNLIEERDVLARGGILG